MCKIMVHSSVPSCLTLTADEGPLVIPPPLRYVALLPYYDTTGSMMYRSKHETDSGLWEAWEVSPWAGRQRPGPPGRAVGRPPPPASSCPASVGKVYIHHTVGSGSSMAPLDRRYQTTQSDMRGRMCAHRIEPCQRLAFTPVHDPCDTHLYGLESVSAHSEHRSMTLRPSRFWHGMPEQRCRGLDAGGETYYFKVRYICILGLKLSGKPTNLLCGFGTM
jgi:hypothetical protein